MTAQVEDSSPLLVYDPPGAWSDSSQDDPLLSVSRDVPPTEVSLTKPLFVFKSYSGQSYHTTATQGATATIEFYGTL